MTITLTEPERFILAYVLYSLRRSGAAPDPHDPEGVVLDYHDHLSDHEFAVLWRLGLRIIDTEGESRS